VFEGRENRKKSTAPASASERATHEAFRSVKKTAQAFFSVHMLKMALDKS
jgi:hypothetical protein